MLIKYIFTYLLDANSKNWLILLSYLLLLSLCIICRYHIYLLLSLNNKNAVPIFRSFSHIGISDILSAELFSIPHHQILLTDLENLKRELYSVQKRVVGQTQIGLGITLIHQRSISIWIRGVLLVMLIRYLSWLTKKYL